LEAKVRLPQHVAHRSFPSETVVLNLQTGKYHGLNPTAGRMLEVLVREGSVRAAAALMAEQYQQPQADVERDICDLCEGMIKRGLLEIEEDDAG
jgi:Coenzyme PQQ synthesis protein D (PqqD)